MLALRTAFAWTLLVVLAIGGTVAPTVHRAVHGLEREAMLAAHTADGHHGAETGTRARGSCATSDVLDVACALCQGTFASMLAPSGSVLPGTASPAIEARTVDWTESARTEAPTGRGPPETVA